MTKHIVTSKSVQIASVTTLVLLWQYVLVPLFGVRPLPPELVQAIGAAGLIFGGDAVTRVFAERPKLTLGSSPKPDQGKGSEQVVDHEGASRD